MLRRLERAGVIERQPRPGGYAPPARLPHARRHQAGAVGYRHLDPAEARLQAGMTEAEQALLRRLLLQMLSNVASEGTGRTR